jgi:uncharacterized protein involved in exopolysaccharide biosynthesis
MPELLGSPEVLESKFQPSAAAHDKETLTNYDPEAFHEIDLAGLMRTIWRGKVLVLAVAFLTFLLSVVMAISLPNQYSSTASFIPPSSSGNSSAAALASQLAAVGGGGLLGAAKSTGDLYAGILGSRSIAEKLIQRFDLKKAYGAKRESDAVKSLAAHTVVLADTKSGILTVTVTDKSPERARDLANGYLDALRETNGRLALTESSQRRFFFDQQLAKEKNDLADAEVELKKVEEQTGFIAPAGQTSAEIQTITQTRAQIAVRQVELSALRQSSTDMNPDMVLLRSEISDLEGQLARLQAGGQGRETGAIPTEKVPQLQLTYVRREREVKYHEALFEMLARQDEAARLDESRDAPLLQVLDPASAPDRPSSPHRTLIAAGGLLLGLTIGIGFVLGRAYFVHTQPVAY